MYIFILKYSSILILIVPYLIDNNYCLSSKKFIRNKDFITKILSFSIYDLIIKCTLINIPNFAFQDFMTIFPPNFKE